MFGIPAPYVMGALLFAGFLGGYKVRDWQCDAAYSKALEKAAKQKEQAQEVLDTKANAYEETRSAAEATSIERTNTIREIYKTVPVPVSADCPAPPNGVVGVLIESIRGTDTPGTTREPRVPVQEPE